MLLGGAALTRGYVENDLAEVYEGEVHYARDAFEGLKLMDVIMSAKRGEAPDVDSPEARRRTKKEAERKARHERSKRIAAERKAKETPIEVPARSDVAADVEVPTPPFWGSRVVKGVALADYTGLLDERALFLGQWGLRGVKGGKGPSYEELVETEGRPRLRHWLDRLSTEGILAHAAVVYGYFPAVSEGDDVVVLTEPRPDAPERFRFTFPRQQRDRFLDIADFIRSRELATERNQVDVLPFQLVTMGQPIADFANELFASDSYRDYLEVHGIGVQLTEALAEYWHRRIREELKYTDHAMAAEDPGFGGGVLQARLPRRQVLVRLRRMPELGRSREDDGVAGARPDRRRAVRGASATPRAVHRRVRAAPPRGQVLQRLGVSGTVRRCAPPTARPIRPGFL